MTLYVRTGGIYQPVGFNNYLQRHGGVYSKAQELFVRAGGGYQRVWLADGPPPEPVGLTASAANGGSITVGWAYQANAENDYNRVEVQQVGDVARISTAYAGTSQVRTGYAHGAVPALQARTVDNGGQVSAWMSVPAVAAVNATPGAANLTPPLAYDGNGGFVFKWTDPGNPYGDISSVQVYWKLESEANYTLFGTYGTAGGTRQVTLPVRAWDAVHYAKVRVNNSAGYADSAFLGAWAPPAPGTVKDIRPHEGNSYAYAAGGWRNDGTVRQGQFSPTPMGQHFGCFFYGSQLYDASHGYPAVGGDIFMIRRGTEGFTGNVNFTGHGYQVNPGSAPTGAGPGWVSQGQFAGAESSGWETLNPVLGSFATGECAGVGIFTFSGLQSLYRVFRGPAENADAGLIRLRW